MKSISKVLIFLVTACLACSVTAQNTCMDQCNSGCFVDFAHQRCLACPAGCANCTNPDTCDICAPGYYLNEQKNCVECNVTGCATCTAQGVCSSCQSGWFLKNSSSCAYCGYLCEECESENRCKKCRNDESMYYGIYRSARTGTCNYCPDGCKTCVSSGFCTSCKSGYSLSDFQCITCSTIDPDCRTCDESITQCTSCGPGRYLLDNSCLECSSGCDTCTDDSRCQKCMEGYFLNAHHGCTPCMSGCKECKNSQTCTQCHNGFEYDEEQGRCVSCNLDCYGVMSPIYPLPYPIYTTPIMRALDAEPMAMTLEAPMAMSMGTVEAPMMMMPASAGGADLAPVDYGTVGTDTEIELAKAEAEAEMAKMKEEEVNTAKSDATADEVQAITQMEKAQINADVANADVNSINTSETDSQ